MGTAIPSSVPLASPPAARGGIASSLPWAVAGIALLALLAMSAGKFFNASRGSSLDAPLNALPQAALGEASPLADDPTAGAMSGSRGPDISKMSPEERAERLFNRVMLLASAGKSDSVLFFAPMAIEAYRLITPMTLDHRYDMGRIAEVAGAIPLAKAQADTILLENPNHLLGLILGARIASLSDDTAARRGYESRILAVEKTEAVKKLPEYDRHRDDIVNAIANARRSVGTKG
ncbi:MAG: hypothetical protein M3O61_00380 [Gemmatimonadota bacterium]|nr:hypothetical protein [Gemmatimonadota bacterium]